MRTEPVERTWLKVSSKGHEATFVPIFGARVNISKLADSLLVGRFIEFSSSIYILRTKTGVQHPVLLPLVP